MSGAEPPKVLFFIWALEVGGAERLLARLVQHIPSGRFRAKVVCLSRRGVWAEEVEAAGVPVICARKRTGFDPMILFRLVALIRHEKPDLVNTHLWTADVWARMAAVLARVPVVVTEQNVDVWKRWYHRIIDRLLFRGTKVVICVSNAVAEFYRTRIGVPAGKLRVIPNAIDLRTFKSGDGRLREEAGVEPGAYLFVCAARLHPQKGHSVLLDAVRQLVDADVGPFAVLLAGSGPLRGEIEARVRERRLAHHVRLLGLRDDMPSLFLQCDAFVLASLYEGLPLAILEAMAAGLPIVATTVGGVGEVVEHRRHGLLVPPGDAHALAAAMAELIRNPAQGRAMGQAARAIVQRDYSIDVIAERTMAVFDACLAGSP